MKNNLFISQKVTIHRNNKQLKLVFENLSKDIPISIIENLFLIGSGITLTNGARSLLLENNKSIFYYTAGYKMQGVLSNTKLQSNYRNRLFQYDAYNLKALDISKHIVQKKINSMEKVFDLHLNKYRHKIYDVANHTELLGVEGIATTSMFKIFKKYLLASKIEDFKKREYRPTKDKVNGILSFTYTLYSNLLYGLVLSEGYDPYIGFLHKKRGTHYAFVSDLIEYDRANLTKFVLLLFVKKVLNDEDFDGIYLNTDGRKKFLLKFNEYCQENFEKSRDNLNEIGDLLV